MTDQQEKWRLPFHPFKCVVSKQFKLGRTSTLNY